MKMGTRSEYARGKGASPAASLERSGFLRRTGLTVMPIDVQFSGVASVMAGSIRSECRSGVSLSAFSDRDCMTNVRSAWPSCSAHVPGSILWSVPHLVKLADRPMTIRGGLPLGKASDHQVPRFSKVRAVEQPVLHQPQATRNVLASSAIRVHTAPAQRETWLRVKGI